MMQPIRASDVVQEVDETDPNLSMELDNNFYAAELRVGDNFDVSVGLGNAEGVDFYILQCMKCMYLVEEETLTDVWKGVVERDDEVVKGFYYK